MSVYKISDNLLVRTLRSYHIIVSKDKALYLDFTLQVY